MTYKKVILFVAAVVILEIMYSVPSYNTWFNTKIFNENISISDQSEHLDVEERMQYRFGGSYNIFQSIKQMLKSQNDTDAIILLPPIPYVNQVGAERGFTMCEPDIFYYFCGLKGDVANSPDVQQSKYALVIENHKVGLKKITDKHYLDSLIALYKPFY